MSEVSSNIESGTSTTTSMEATAMIGTTTTVGSNTTGSSSSTTTTAGTGGGTNKYDRQLRIWGSKGQYHVSNTCIVAIHVTAVATETIKNCILPGIQHIHIIDLVVNNIVHPSTGTWYPNITMKPINSEYASNFFLTDTASTTSSTTNTRAAMALQYLLELNPDVSGTYETYDMTNNNHGFATTTTTTTSSTSTSTSTTDDDDDDDSNENIFQKKLLYLQSIYQNVIVLGCDLDLTMIHDITRSISSLTTTSSLSSNHHHHHLNHLNHIPFLTVNSYGMMGILQIQYLPIHPIMNPNGSGGSSGSNTNPNATITSRTVPDLRLLHPFTLLQNYIESFIETHFMTTTTTNHHVNEGDRVSSSSSSSVPFLSTHEYGNIPYPILLYHAYHYLWKHQYPNIVRPNTIEQKKEFQLLIQNHYYDMTTTSSTTTMNRITTTTIHQNELPINVQEAIQNSYLAYTEPQVDMEHLQSLLDRLSTYHQQYPSVRNVEGMKFFLVLQAIYQFMTSSSSSSLPQSPVHGNIPDMTASTNAYIELQSIYKEQSKIDMARLRTFITIASNKVEWMSHDNNKNVIDWNTLIDDEYIRTFCFNIHNIDIIACHRIPNTEHNNRMNINDNDIGTEIAMMLDDYTDNDINEDVQIPFLWYICYEACQLFHQQEHRYPGAFDNDESELLWQDAKQLQSYIVQILQHNPKFTGLDTHPVIQRTLLQPYSNNDSNEMSIPMTVEDDNTNDTTTGNTPTHHHPSKYAIEMVRYGNGEIHTIASIMGGITAQEMIKIITYQYVPMNNTYVYNGITSTGSVYTV